MTKSELGEKRRCLNCSTPFFDLNRNPIVCPKCKAVFDVVEIVRSSSKYARPRPAEFSGGPLAGTFPADAVLLDDEREDGESAIRPTEHETDKSEVPA